VSVELVFHIGQSVHCSYGCDKCRRRGWEERRGEERRGKQEQIEEKRETGERGNPKAR
jgi:hypothetical protein